MYPTGCLVFISIWCLLLNLSQLPCAAKVLFESVILCLSEIIDVRVLGGASYDHNILSCVQHMSTWHDGHNARVTDSCHLEGCLRDGRRMWLQVAKSQPISKHMTGGAPTCAVTDKPDALPSLFTNKPLTGGAQKQAVTEQCDAPPRHTTGKHVAGGARTHAVTDSPAGAASHFTGKHAY